MQNVFQKVIHKPFYSPLSALDSIYSIFQYSLKRIKYTWKKRERESVKVPPCGTFRGQCCYHILSEGECNPFSDSTVCERCFNF